jgi:hypothetical protein
MKDLRLDPDNEDRVMVDFHQHTLNNYNYGQYNYSPTNPSELPPVSPRKEVELKIHVDEFGDD